MNNLYGAGGNGDLGIGMLLAGMVGLLLMLYSLYFLVPAVRGIFRKPRVYPKAERKRRLALLIPARNEEKVIGRLLKSIRFKQ